MISMKWLLVALCWNASTGWADSIELSFPKDLNRYHFQNVYEEEIKSNKLKNPLSVWRQSEVNKKYKECVTKGPSLLNNNKPLIGWIFSVWANCTFKFNDEKLDQKTILTYFENVKIHSQIILAGPWRASILMQTQKIIQVSINEIEKNSKKSGKLKTKVLSLLDTDDVYQNTEIRKWFQGQMDAKQPSMSVASKTRSANKLLEPADLNVQKKILTLDDYASSDISRSIVQMEPIMDSLRATYRKMDYRKIVDLAPKLESLYRNSELYREYSMIMGRSFQLVGDYSKALDSFKVVQNYYSESADVDEALFRSGLVFLRMNEMNLAQKQFERLMQLDHDKYDITGRYWWIRSMQYSKDARELEEKVKFAADYPFSYFGIRMGAELNEGKIKPAKGAAMAPIKWSLTGKNADVWRRFVKLSELGWVLEAQTEMQSFSWPQNPLKVFYLSMILSKASLHPLSVKNVTPLLETYSEVRSLDAIKEIYPKSYLSLILKEKEKYPLHEHLILSLIRQESSFGLKALSSSQAAGLMQMIQPTALEIAASLKMKIDFPEDLYRPKTNIPMGVYYIHQVIKDMNYNVPLGLAGYNAGPHKIKQFLNQREITKKIFDAVTDKDYPGMEELWFDELPWAETTGYVKSILRNTLIYELIDKGEYQYRPDFWRDFVLK